MNDLKNAGFRQQRFNFREKSFKMFYRFLYRSFTAATSRIQVPTTGKICRCNFIRRKITFGPE